ncbi:MAG: hypothetical protein WC943_10285 [Elusimicrobiota bacterium]|jgi:hypothetical protein
MTVSRALRRGLPAAALAFGLLLSGVPVMAGDPPDVVVEVDPKAEDDGAGGSGEIGAAAGMGGSAGGGAEPGGKPITVPDGTNSYGKSCVLALDKDCFGSKTTGDPGAPGTGAGGAQPGKPGADGAYQDPGQLPADMDGKQFFTGDGGAYTTADLEAMVKSGKTSDVEAMMDRILRADPENADALVVRSWARLNQDDKNGALKDADAALDADPKNETAQQIKDFIELTGRAAGTDLRLKKPEFESKNMGARFENMAGGGFDGGMGKLMSGGAMRGPGQAGGGGSGRAGTIRPRQGFPRRRGPCRCRRA